MPLSLGVYGSQRILNGKPKWPHYGLDFAADEGTKVKAMLDGIVTLAEPDLFYTGGTLIFDHGHGISTLYMHMEELLVKEGTKSKTGRYCWNSWVDWKSDRSSLRRKTKLVSNKVRSRNSS